MNPTATPIFYDISGIPTFAWVPSAAIWLLLIFFLLCLVLLSIYAPKFKPKPKTGKLFERAISELESITSRATLNKEDFYRASLLTRRVLTAAANANSVEANIAEMSASELRHLSKSTKNANQRRLLEALLNVEVMKYSPNSVFDPNLLHSLYSELVTYSKSL